MCERVRPRAPAPRAAGPAHGASTRARASVEALTPTSTYIADRVATKLRWNLTVDDTERAT
ncbi:hypothetical protein Sfulv_59100 [Streptomyces fulvorobeus]|uniref:Uncharacterized protein n=1 Tax=Streptomyces fulvorobeus TaxID=284028 RepID=A0A7J0CF21_9ACTN|nr:hypothetical protein Sfulv_59100 [Streptomyces fulvorobeus]